MNKNRLWYDRPAPDRGVVEGENTEGIRTGNPGLFRLGADISVPVSLEKRIMNGSRLQRTAWQIHFVRGLTILRK